MNFSGDPCSREPGMSSSEENNQPGKCRSKAEGGASVGVNRCAACAGRMLSGEVHRSLTLEQKSDPSHWQAVSAV